MTLPEMQPEHENGGTSAIGPMLRRQPGWTIVVVAGVLTSGTSSAEAETLWQEHFEWHTCPTNSVGNWEEGPYYRIGQTAEATGSPRVAAMEVGRWSGLSWEQLARLMGVARRSLHFWASGRPLSPAREERLMRLLAVLRQLDRGSARANRSMLLSVCADDTLPIDLLAEGRFAEVVELLGPGIGRMTTQPASLEKQELISRRPPPPEVLVDALQDRVHRETGVARVVRASGVKK